jgi:cellulose synthase/poly-beta-1,6-N-acetylglucosamine synthase-like glycosyltransferase
MTIIFYSFLILTTAIYIWWVLGFVRGLGKLPVGRNEKLYTVSVIIPARNEEKNIRACLESVLGQTYPADNYEVIVVDDRSTDRTASLAAETAAQQPRVKIITIGPQESAISGKKLAIGRGIRAAQGEIIMVVDADCVVQPGWMAGMLRYFADDVGVVAGATFFQAADEQRLFHKIQSLDALVLVAAGAGSMSLGRPVICNGSNLAYRRPVFDEVQGFAGIDKLASGDDDLFIQKVRQQTHWRVVFCNDPGTYDWTQPAVTWRGFFNQRIRWSSKGVYYPDKIFVAQLVNTYVCYVVSLAAVALVCGNPEKYAWLLAVLTIKFAAEVLVLVRGCMVFKRPDLIKYFLWLGIPHMPYIVAVSTLGFFKKFKWK